MAVGADAESSDPQPQESEPRRQERNAEDRVKERAPMRRVRISIEQRDVQKATIRVLVLISLWLVALWVVGVARHFLFLILLAWLTAIATEPAIQWFLRRGLSRARSTAVVGGSTIVVLAGLAVIFERMLFDQVTQLVRDVPATVQSVVVQANSTFGVSLNPAQVTSALHIDPDQIQSLAQGLAGGFFGWVGSLLAVILDLVTVVVFSFYIAGAGPRLVQHVAVWLPPDRQPMLGEIWDIAEQKTGGYVASKIALAAVFIGAAIWGPIGAIIGVPIVAVVVSVVETYGRRYELVPALASDPESEPDADERVVDAEAGHRHGHDTKGSKDSTDDDD